MTGFGLAQQSLTMVAVVSNLDYSGEATSLLHNERVNTFRLEADVVLSSQYYSSACGLARGWEILC